MEKQGEGQHMCRSTAPPTTTPPTHASVPPGISHGIVARFPNDATEKLLHAAAHTDGRERNNNGFLVWIDYELSRYEYTTGVLVVGKGFTTMYGQKRREGCGIPSLSSTGSSTRALLLPSTGSGCTTAHCRSAVLPPRLRQAQAPLIALCLCSSVSLRSERKRGLFE